MKFDRGTMNRFLAPFALLVAVLSSTPADAQFGIRGGVNLTRLVGGESLNVESRQGLNFGGSARLMSVGPVSIVPEVYYSQKGATMDGTASQGAAPRLEFSLDYIEVPVLARLALPIPGLQRLQPYVAAGPSFAWQLRCDVSLVDGDATASARECGEQFGSTSTAFRDADRGVVFTAGVELPVLGMGAVNLEARLVRGLARLIDADAAQPDLRNQAFSLMLGYSFGI
jgi:hypothetical protein